MAAAQVTSGSYDPERTVMGCEIYAPQEVWRKAKIRDAFDNNTVTTLNTLVPVNISRR